MDVVVAASTATAFLFLSAAVDLLEAARPSVASRKIHAIL